MLGLNFDRARRVLCLGAHADDLEIGCGGTIRRMLRESPEIEIWWHVFSAPGERRHEARGSARELLDGARTAAVRIASFRESYFPQQWGRIKDTFEAIKDAFEPDLVLTHWRDDRHQDHRVLSDLAWNTFRSHTILEYEIPKYDGDLGNPNVYVSLGDDTCRQKVAAVLRHFKTQRTRHWFTEDALLGLLRLRGIECGPGTRYAEAFYGRKLIS